MSIDIYSTHELLGVVRTLRPPLTFWLSLCFGREKLFGSEWIDFDEIISGRRMAPFVAPNVAGRVMKEEGYNTKKFKPAYLKPKHAVDPTRTLTRRAGEAIGGDMSPTERYQANVADLLNSQYEMIVRRWEWMASQAVQFAEITVSGDDYPTQTVDFGRTINDKNLTANDRWSVSHADSDPFADIDAWMTEMFQTGGYPATVGVFGTQAYAAMAAKQQFKDYLDVRRATGTPFDIGPGNGLPAQYKGTLTNGLEVWVYNDIYENNSGSNVAMMDPRDVVLVNPAGLEGVRCFGAIMDARNGYAPATVFPKMWEQEDPSAVYVMTQSAPLMVPMRPNASLRARVINDA